MKIKAVLLTLLFAFAFCFMAFKNNEKPEDPVTVEVKEVILKSYVHGAFNALDADAMRNGFHPDFAIFSAKGEEIKKYPIGKWADGTEKRKSKPDFDPEKNKWGHKFVSVDVTGGSAAVKIELSKDGELVYTDYLSLLKFDSGWKIVAKVYHSHKK